MKIFFVLILFLMLVGPCRSFAQENFKKSVFYGVMDNGDVAAIKNELSLIESAEISNKIGYEGALLMKEADLVKRPKKKLDLFMAGRKKLETALLIDNSNTEFHFLRLAVQEHAPKILKYHWDIERDKAVVEENFKNLSPSVQNAILQYCKKSKVLHKQDFSGAQKL